MFLYILLIVIITIKLLHYIYNRRYKESFDRIPSDNIKLVDDFLKVCKYPEMGKYSYCINGNIICDGSGVLNTIDDEYTNGTTYENTCSDNTIPKCESGYFDKNNTSLELYTYDSYTYDLSNGKIINSLNSSNNYNTFSSEYSEPPLLINQSTNTITYDISDIEYETDICLLDKNTNAYKCLIEKNTGIPDASYNEIKLESIETNPEIIKNTSFIDWNKTNEYQLSEENAYINQYKSMFGNDNLTNGYTNQYKNTKSCVNSNILKCLIPNLLK